MTASTLTRPPYLKIGAVADLLGVSVDAIARAERAGRIPAAPRETGADDRVYTPETVEVLRSHFSSRK